MSPRLVIFDLGRVLIRICDDWRHACVVAGVPVPAGQLDERAQAALHQAVCDTEVGKIDLDGFAHATCSLMGIEPQHVKRLSDAYLLGPYPGSEELLDELHARGVHTACLSNTNANHWRLLLDPAGPHYGTMRRLTHQFASHLVGARKPDEAIFAHVERQCGRTGPEIAFFDDLPANVVAASSRGWHARHIDPLRDPLPQLRKYLQELELLG